MAASKFARHKAWLKALNKSKELRDIAVTARKVRGGGVDIRMIAKVIAEHGSNGIGCYAGEDTLALIMGCDRKTIQRARATLIEKGWFTVTSEKGGKNRRSKVLDISQPDVWPGSVEATVPVSGDHPVAGCSEHESFDAYCMYCRMKAEYEQQASDAV